MCLNKKCNKEFVETTPFDYALEPLILMKIKCSMDSCT